MTDSTRRKVLTWGLFAGSCLLAVAGAAGFGLHLLIKDSVDENLTEAQETFSGDGVEAAIAMLETNYTSIKAKGRMIWTLGTIGDDRALPVLLSLHTGEECRHGTGVCQYEVGKAIRKIRKEGQFGVSKPLLAGVWFLSLLAMTTSWWRVRKHSAGGPRRTGDDHTGT